MSDFSKMSEDELLRPDVSAGGDGADVEKPLGKMSDAELLAPDVDGEYSPSPSNETAPKPEGRALGFFERHGTEAEAATGVRPSDAYNDPTVGKAMDIAYSVSPFAGTAARAIAGRRQKSLDAALETGDACGAFGGMDEALKEWDATEGAKHDLYQRALKGDADADYSPLYAKRFNAKTGRYEIDRDEEGRALLDGRYATPKDEARREYVKGLAAGQIAQTAEAKANAHTDLANNTASAWMNLAHGATASLGFAGEFYLGGALAKGALGTAALAGTKLGKAAQVAEAGGKLGLKARTALASAELAAPTIANAIARYENLTANDYRMDEDGNVVLAEQGDGAFRAGAKALGGAAFENATEVALGKVVNKVFGKTCKGIYNKVPGVKKLFDGAVNKAGDRTIDAAKRAWMNATRTYATVQKAAHFELMPVGEFAEEYVQGMGDDVLGFGNRAAAKDKTALDFSRDFFDWDAGFKDLFFGVMGQTIALGLGAHGMRRANDFRNSVDAKVLGTLKLHGYNAADIAKMGTNARLGLAMQLSDGKATKEMGYGVRDYADFLGIRQGEVERFAKDAKTMADKEAFGKLSEDEQKRIAANVIQFTSVLYSTASAFERGDEGAAEMMDRLNSRMRKAMMLMEERQGLGNSRNNAGTKPQDFTSRVDWSATSDAAGNIDWQTDAATGRQFIESAPLGDGKNGVRIFQEGDRFRVVHPQSANSNGYLADDLKTAHDYAASLDQFAQKRNADRAVMRDYVKFNAQRLVPQAKGRDGKAANATSPIVTANNAQDALDSLGWLTEGDQRELQNAMLDGTEGGALKLEDGTVLVLLDNLRDTQDALLTLAHELGGHAAIAEGAKEKGLSLADTVAEVFKTSANRDEKQAATEYGIRLGNGESEQSARAAAQEEGMVYGNEYRMPVVSPLQSAKTAVKAWMKRRGMDAKLTDSDYDAIAAAGLRRIRSTQMRTGDTGTDTVDGSGIEVTPTVRGTDLQNRHDNAKWVSDYYAQREKMDAARAALDAAEAAKRNADAAAKEQAKIDLAVANEDERQKRLAEQEQMRKDAEHATQYGREMVRDVLTGWYSGKRIKPEQVERIVNGATDAEIREMLDFIELEMDGKAGEDAVLEVAKGVNEAVVRRNASDAAKLRMQKNGNPKTKERKARIAAEDKLISRFVNEVQMNPHSALAFWMENGHRLFAYPQYRRIANKGKSAGFRFEFVGADNSIDALNAFFNGVHGSKKDDERKKLVRLVFGENATPGDGDGDVAMDNWIRFKHRGPETAASDQENGLTNEELMADADWGRAENLLNRFMDEYVAYEEWKAGDQLTAEERRIADEIAADNARIDEENAAIAEADEAWGDAIAMTADGKPIADPAQMNVGDTTTVGNDADGGWRLTVVGRDGDVIQFADRENPLFDGEVFSFKWNREKGDWEDVKIQQEADRGGQDRDTAEAAGDAERQDGGGDEGAAGRESGGNGRGTEAPSADTEGEVATEVKRVVSAIKSAKTMQDLTDAYNSFKFKDIDMVDGDRVDHDSVNSAMSARADEIANGNLTLDGGTAPQKVASVKSTAKESPAVAANTPMSAKEANKALGMDAALNDRQLAQRMKAWEAHAKERPEFAKKLEAAKVVLEYRKANGKADPHATEVEAKAKAEKSDKYSSLTLKELREHDDRYSSDEKVSGSVEAEIARREDEVRGTDAYKAYAKGMAVSDEELSSAIRKWVADNYDRAESIGKRLMVVFGDEVEEQISIDGDPRKEGGARKGVARIMPDMVLRVHKVVAEERDAEEARRKAEAAQKPSEETGEVKLGGPTEPTDAGFAAWAVGRDGKPLSFASEAEREQSRKVFDTLVRRGVVDGSTGASAVRFRREENAEYRAVEAKYRGTDGWMKAPNGKPTNLTERQWVQVRTPSFKAWFGDWENDPENASKVVDENGEPKVVYHGSADFTPDAGFHVFGTGGRNESYGAGAFFASNKSVADQYANDGAPYEVFLNIRNPKTHDWNMTLWSEATDDEAVQKAEQEYIDRTGDVDLADFEPNYADFRMTTDDFSRKARSDGHDGAFMYRVMDEVQGGNTANESDIYTVFDPAQVKSATDNTGAFDGRNADIRFRRSAVTPAEDAAYMDAVKRGDMETARRMVREAAAKAMPNTKVVDKDGLPLVVYHGSPHGGHTIFNGEKNATYSQSVRGVTFFSSSRDVGESYSTNPKTKYADLPDGLIEKAKAYLVENNVEVRQESDGFHSYLDGHHIANSTGETKEDSMRKASISVASDMEKDEGSMVYSAFVNISDPLVSDFNGRSWKGKRSDDGYYDNSVPLLAKRAMAKGHDGLIVRNVEDAANIIGRGVADDYAVFSPSQIKSADPVTYDDAGNVIPLSRRFDGTSADIRFRRRTYSPNLPAQALADARIRSLTDALRESRFGSDAAALFAAEKMAREFAQQGSIGPELRDLIERTKTGSAADRAKGNAAALFSPQNLSRWRELMQDSLISLREMEDRLGLKKEVSAYHQFDRNYGLADKEAKDLDREIVAPLAKELNDNGIALADFSMLLQALHGPERNRMIAERSPYVRAALDNAASAPYVNALLAGNIDIDEAQIDEICKRLGWLDKNGVRTKEGKRFAKDLAGSGATTAFWNGKVDAFKASGMYAKAQKAVKLVRKLTRRNRALLVATGRMSRAQASLWAKLSPNYVPLRSDMEMDTNIWAKWLIGGWTEKGGANGKRYSDNEYNHAYGRGTLADNPLEFSIQQYHESLQRAYDNVARRRLAEIVRGNPNLGKVFRYEPQMTPQKRFHYAKEISVIRNMVKAGTATEADIRKLRWYEEAFNADTAIPTIRVLGANGVVHEMPNIAGLEGAKDKPTSIVAFKEDGELKFIRLGGFEQADISGDPKRGIDPNPNLLDDVSARRIATAVKKQNMAQLNGFGREMRKLTGIFSALRTAYSPTFLISNLGADNTQAARNIYSTFGVKAVGKFEHYAFHAFKAAQSVVTGKFGDTKIQRYAKEWYENGGKIGGMATTSISDLTNGIKRTMRQLNSQKQQLSDIDSFGDLVRWMTDRKDQFEKFAEHWNGVIEMSTRIAAYATARDMGQSVADAVSYSRDITVNFNRKGTITPWTNALYAFSNATMQDLHRSLVAFGEGDYAKGSGILAKRGAIMGFGLTAMGFLASVFGFWQDDDEDESEGKAQWKYAKDWEKQNTLGVRIGEKTYGVPIRGISRVPYYLGHQIWEAMSGRKDVTKAAIDTVALAASNAGDFMGQASSPLMTAVPSVARDPLDIFISNRTFTGRQRYREPLPGQEQTAVRSEMGRKDTSEAAKIVAKALNAATGGDEKRRGWIDLQPEKVQGVWEWLFGSAGKDISNIVGTAKDAATMNLGNRDLRNIPYLSRFARNLSENSADYYEARSRYEQAKKHYNGMNELGNADKMREDVAEHPWLSSHGSGKRWGKQLLELDGAVKKLMEMEKAASAGDYDAIHGLRLKTQYQFMRRLEAAPADDAEGVSAEKEHRKALAPLLRSSKREGKAEQREMKKRKRLF